MAASLVWKDSRLGLCLDGKEGFNLRAACAG